MRRLPGVDRVWRILRRVRMSVFRLKGRATGKPIAVLMLCFIPWSAGISGLAETPRVPRPRPSGRPELQQRSSAHVASHDSCPRPAIGSSVPEPEDLRSHNGVLKVELTVHNSTGADGPTRYCYIDANGAESPNLRLHPGDLLILTLKNDLVGVHGGDAAAGGDMHMSMDIHGVAAASADPCTSGLMTATSTNLHFHGLTIPPACHQDEVLKTSIQPGDAPFEYRFRIPENEPPGLYWYHPHIHGFSKAQVLGGASGTIIIEGIERANPRVAGLPERVLIIRDQDLVNPDAPPSKSEPVVPKMLIDRDGDAANNGTGFGKPAKDLSINFVPVPYPDYRPAAITMKPEEEQLWRVLNASAITYLNLEVLYNRAPQQLGLVALDGVPLNQSEQAGDGVGWQTHLGLPPGARTEFIVKGPPAGVTGLLVTRTVDTGPGGENDPNRMIATITASPDSAEPQARLEASPNRFRRRACRGSEAWLPCGRGSCTSRKSRSTRTIRMDQRDFISR